MVRHPKTCPPGTTVAQARHLLRDDHVHALLVVDGDHLLTVIERADLTGPPDACAGGTLLRRTVGPGADLDRTRVEMVATGRRRLAVVTPDLRLLGLLCLKRSRSGFCSDAGVNARAAERRRTGAPGAGRLGDGAHR